MGRKKELERQMARIEAELSKSQKELFSLNQMMETYQNNPKFGNSKKFQSEIQNLHSHVSELESALTSIRAEHVQVEERLGALRARTSSPNIRLSPTARLQRGGSSNSSVNKWLDANEFITGRLGKKAEQQQQAGHHFG